MAQIAERNDISKVLKIDSDLININIGDTSYGFDNDNYKSVKMFMELNLNGPTMELPDLGVECRIADPPTLMAIKRSHLYYRHFWHKHAEDYTFLKSKGVTLDDDHKKAMKARMEERAARDNYKVAKSLDTTNEQFFARSDKSVNRKFIHDDLHQAVAYGDRALFEQLKYDTARAKLEYDLFEKLKHEDKLRLVKEEAYVIGLERIIIPEWYTAFTLEKEGLSHKLDYKSKALFAYKYAIMRISTDLTKGWFRDFAIENYSDLCQPDADYINKFEDAFKSGSLRLI